MIDLITRKHTLPCDVPDRRAILRVVGDRVVVWDPTGEVGSYPVGDLHSLNAVRMFDRVPTPRLRGIAKRIAYMTAYSFRGVAP